MRTLVGTREGTCAENSKELVVLCSGLEYFENNSRESMNQYGTTIENKVLTKHCDYLTSL